jgi:hypothetical protein
LVAKSFFDRNQIIIATTRMWWHLILLTKALYMSTGVIYFDETLMNEKKIIVSGAVLCIVGLAMGAVTVTEAGAKDIAVAVVLAMAWAGAVVGVIAVAMAWAWKCAAAGPSASALAWAAVLVLALAVAGSGVGALPLAGSLFWAWALVVTGGVLVGFGVSKDRKAF